MVFAFLPFHTAPIFPIMLSIIPGNISPTFRFLHPYVDSLANPPRHAVMHAASFNRPFFIAMSAYVLRSCHLGLQHSALLSFWASIASEAVAAMLDRSRSARLEAQEQKKEDILILLLPILNDGLSFDDIPDLRVGCYMILTILASKASLGDSLLSVMMEAVTSNWDQSSHAGLICLSVLAEQKRTAGLPRKAFDTVIALGHLDDDLMTISKRYKIDRLVLGVALGIISGLNKATDASGLQLLRILTEASFTSDASAKAIAKSIIFRVQTTVPNSRPGFDVQGSLTDLVLRLCDSKDVGAIIHGAIKEANLDLSPLKSRFREGYYSKGNMPEQRLEDANSSEADEEMTIDDFDALTKRIPTRTAYEISFLSHSDSYVYDSLAHAFLSLYTSTTNVKRFSDLPVLRKSLGMTEPLFLSFYVRIWCGHGPDNARIAAIGSVIDYFRKDGLSADVQMLLPYILYALADTSSSVRCSAANLVLVLVPAYGEMAEKESKGAGQPILGQQQIYGQGDETRAVTWLSNKEAARIILDLMVPALEECMLDQSHVSRLISESLNGPQHSRNTNNIQKELRKSLRLALLSSICSHVVNTPLYAVKSRLLEMLNQVPKVGSTSRTKLLLPLLSSTIEHGQHRYELACKEEHLNPLELLDKIVGIVVPSDREGIQTLKSIIEPLNDLDFPTLKATALHRLQTIWTSINNELQFQLARALFESAVSNVELGASDNQKAEAKETLKSLPLSTAILQSFLEMLPSISSSLQDKPPTSKRRRTSQGRSNGNGALDECNLVSAVEQITFVLELIGEVKTERHPELLGGLFQIMSDLQSAQGHPVTAIGYLQILTIEGMLPIVKRAEVCDQ